MTRERDERPGELRSYGRRRGRKLSARQAQLVRETLPRVRPDLSRPTPTDARTLFPSKVSQVWLEIGFGGGEHLVWQARHHPDAGLVGCEPFEDGYVKVLTAIEDGPLPNVLVHPDDARPLLRWLPEGSISRAFILFPTPGRRRGIASAGWSRVRCWTRSPA